MGNHTTQEFTFARTIAPFYCRTNVTVGALYTAPDPSILTCDLELQPETEYSFVFAAITQISGIDVGITYLPRAQYPVWDGFVSFTTPAIGTPLGGIAHPLAPHILNLGIPVDVTLAIIGLVVLLAPLGVITVISRFPRNQELLPIFTIGIAANIFLRFWPPILIILIGLLCGWMLTDFIPRGGARDHSG